MDIQVKDQVFIVGGATAGFGRATALSLMNEGAKVIGIARHQEELTKLELAYPKQFTSIKGDITQSETINKVVGMVQKTGLSGAFINAGGPPAMQFEETRLSDWDDAYRNILRWKVELTQKIVPLLKEKRYGRIVYLESSSVKQPIENLVLSTSLRLAVVGMMKTISQELSGLNITFNVLAPGTHDTAAIDRLLEKKSQLNGLSIEECRKQLISNIPQGSLGDANDLAGLAVWLLSPSSSFVTGQVYALDGGVVKSTM